MSKISLSNDLIKEFFMRETAEIEADQQAIISIRYRLEAECRRKSALHFMKSRFDSSKTKIITALCGLSLVICLSVFFIAPLRTFAQGTYDKIKTMVYSISIGTNNSYIVTQVPKEEAIKGKKFRSIPTEQTSLNPDELSIKVGYPVKIPDALKGGFTLKGKFLGPICEAPAEKIDDTNMQSMKKSFYENKTEIASKKEVAAFYQSNESSSLILVMNNSKNANPFIDYENLATNNKIQKINGIETLYYELPVITEKADSPGAVSQQLPDLSKPAVKIETISILNWHDQGVYHYLVHDNRNSKINLSDLLAAAESVIQN